ncbi:unnamed protein product [Gongylonema pulchrum]|uniref:Uncharacterized protein n=1 Tax=Gongylonema pulchrum TaxID=637853 RepID=A0A183E3D2_9BILA|nr:unnamed protein product [Gongylonema pulchrum]
MGVLFDDALGVTTERRAGHFRRRSASENLCTAPNLKSILKKCASRRGRSHSESEVTGRVKNTADAGNEVAGWFSHKKHVTFSERLVQERLFRRNSSIFGRKKKNIRKEQNKLKKKGLGRNLMQLHRSSSDTIQTVKNED